MVSLQFCVIKNISVSSSAYEKFELDHYFSVDSLLYSGVIMGFSYTVYTTLYYLVSLLRSITFWSYKILKSSSDVILILFVKIIMNTGNALTLSVHFYVTHFVDHLLFTTHTYICIISTSVCGLL